MGTVKSIFNINGGLGDYVFYTLNGKQVVRRKPAKKRGKKNDVSQHVKGLNDEFSKVSSAAKLFREALETECASLSNPAIHSGLMKILLAIKNLDPTEMGMRTVSRGLETEKGREVFRHFKFQKHRAAVPILVNVKRKISEVEILTSDNLPKNFQVIELQLDFENKKFRRATHPFEKFSGGCAISLKRNLRSRKSFIEFWFLSGENFLSGI